MDMIFEKATLEDIDELVAMRIAYLVEDYNGLQDAEKLILCTKQSVLKKAFPSINR